MATTEKHVNSIISKLHKLRDSSRSAPKSTSVKLIFEKQSKTKSQNKLFKKQKEELDYVLSSVFPRKQKELALSDEVESMSSALSSIADIAEQGIISQDESVALAQFLTSRFAEKYLMHILNQTLADVQFECPKDYYMRFMRGAFRK